LASALHHPPSKSKKRFGFSHFEMNTNQYGRKKDFFQRIFGFRPAKNFFDITRTNVLVMPIDQFQPKTYQI